MSAFLVYGLNICYTKPFTIRRKIMDNKKFEQLIDLIINENEERASELFHEIVVEKSRQIYENIMDEEMMGEEGMEEGMGGQTGDLLDEINAEESGVMEEEDSEEFDLSHGDDESAHEEIEDRVVRIEDKLDQLMAEFEEIMSDEDHEGEEEFDHDAEEAGDDLTHDLEQEHDDEEDMDDDEEEDEEDMDDEEDEEDEEEDELDESVMENISLPRVPSPKHGDNGSNARSTVVANSGQRGMASKPVKFSGDAESVPTSPKGPSNAYAKGEGNLPGAGKFVNTPGKNNFAVKGESAPKPKQIGRAHV